MRWYTCVTVSASPMSDRPCATSSRPVAVDHHQVPRPPTAIAPQRTGWLQSFQTAGTAGFTSSRAHRSIRTSRDGCPANHGTATAPVQNASWSQSPRSQLPTFAGMATTSYATRARTFRFAQRYESPRKYPSSPAPARAGSDAGGAMAAGAPGSSAAAVAAARSASATAIERGVTRRGRYAGPLPARSGARGGAARCRTRRSPLQRSGVTMSFSTTPSLAAVRPNPTPSSTRAGFPSWSRTANR